MNQDKITMTFTVEERQQFNLEMMKILEKYTKEEIKRGNQNSIATIKEIN